MENKYLYFALSLVGLVVIVVAQLFYYERLWEQTFVFIPKIQAGANDTQITVWGLYSDLGLDASLLPIVIFFPWKGQRTRCIYYLSAFLLIVCFTNITKLGYHDPRPFWVSTTV